MKETTKDSGKRKSVMAAIWESMTKTGGCCGSGGNCCGPSQPQAEKKKAGQKPAVRTS
jgi:hypothetical protein